MDDSFPESIAVRPERDFRIEAIIDNKQLWETMMLLAGPQYAGHEDNARKLPAWTLPDFRSRSEASLQCAIGSGMQNVSDALYFCFYSNRLSSLPHEAISVSKQDLWWLAQRGDSILLSDGIIHHLTSIDKVDNETGRIYFFDPWPDFFFLKEGLNQAGVAARTAGGLSISKKEFNRVVRGIVTLDTPDLIAHYLAARADQAEDHNLLFRFSLALLASQRKRFACTAAAYLQQALNIAEKKATATEAIVIAAGLFYALNLAMDHLRIHSDDPLYIKPLEEDLNELVSHYSRPELLGKLDAEQLCALGNAAGHIEDFPRAEAYLDLALQQDPNHEKAYWLRTKARIGLKKLRGVVDDADQGIVLNKSNANKVRLQRDARDPRDRIGIGEDNNLLAVMGERKVEMLANRVAALMALEEDERAVADLKELIELDADKKAVRFFSLGVIATKQNRKTEAKQWLQKSIEEESDFQKQNTYRNYLLELDRTDEKPVEGSAP